MARYVPMLRVESHSMRLLLDVNAESRMGLSIPEGQVSVVGAPADTEVMATVGSAIFGLWEQTDYRLTVEPKNVGEKVSIRTRSSSLINGVSAIGATGIRSGVINFGSQVGIVDFVLTSPAETLQIELEVFPSKVDYKDDYHDLLSAIDSHSNRLLFRFYQATHRLSGSRERKADDRDIDWLTILRGEVAQLMDGVRIIDLHPHEVLHQNVSYARIHRIRRFGGSTVAAIRQGKGKGSWTRLGSVAARERLPADTRVRSWDSPEHRWIHGQLNLISARVGRIRAGIGAQTSNGSVQDGAVKADILRELDQLDGTIRMALRTEPVREARSDPGAISIPSTVLHSKSGYSQIYRSIVALRDILALVGVTREASISNIARLYEQWCFLEVVDVVRSQFPSADPVQELRIISERLLAPSIDEGASVLVYGADGLRISVSNNEAVRTATGEHKPDILISIEQPGRRPIKLVLDAKYRRNVPRNGRGHMGPGQDAINAMHRYRDAVAVRHDGIDLRPVTHAVALFPANAQESDGYEKASLFRSIASAGIGALPFLPGNVSLVRDWLGSLLADPELALNQAGLPTSREAERGSSEVPSGRD